MELNEYLLNFKQSLELLLESAGIFAPLLACVFIVVEAILPFLPLFVFVSVNFLAFGTILGFIISWLLTVSGCMLVFHMIRKGFYKWFQKYMKDKKTLEKSYNYVNNLKLTQLAMIIAMPFTPSFAVNIAAGLTNISYKKYLITLLVGKIFSVFFWGFIGKSIVESLTDIKTLVIIISMLVLAYILSYIINKLLKNRV